MSAGRCAPYVRVTTHTRSDMTPTVRGRPEQPYVALGAEVNLPEWGPVTAWLARCWGWVQRHLALAAPPFLRYWIIGGEEKRFPLEVGAPIEREVAGDDPLQASRVPAGSCATVVHVGHPDRLEGSLARLEGWIENRGLQVGPTHPER